MGRPRRRHLAFAALAPLLLLAAGATGSPAAAEPLQGAATRVTTWNLFAPGTGGPSQYSQEIARARPDVIGVEEACRNSVSATVHELETFYGLHYYVMYGMVGRDWKNCGFNRSFNFGQAILSLTPITDRVNRRYSQGGTESRAYLAVTTTVAGEPTRVFVTHLAQAGQADVRAVEVRELLRATAPFSRAVVLGDFNTDPFSRELQPLWPVFHDVDPHCGAQQNSACTPTADAGPPRKKFDYVLLRGLTSTGFSVVDSQWSDHDLVTGYIRSAPRNMR